MWILIYIQLSYINGNINVLQNNTTNIQWNGTATTINGITRHGGISALVNNPLYLREYTDTNHIYCVTMCCVLCVVCCVLCVVCCVLYAVRTFI